MTVVFPDAMVDLRSWMRTHPDMQPLHGGRVFFRIPNNPSAAPFMRLYRMGGAVIPNSEIPMQDLRISVEVWGMKDGDYPAVRQLVAALESACHTYNPNTTVGGTIVSDLTVSNAIDSPDPETGWPRYIVDLSALVLIADVVPA